VVIVSQPVRPNGGVVVAANVIAPAGAQVSAAGDAAVATLAATAGQAWNLAGILGGYDDDPTGGLLTIAWGANSIVIPVTSGGPLPHLFPVALRFPINTTVTITLGTGGGVQIARVYVIAWLE
jgi:hypothetical protein